ncbi:MAG: proline dehydrogenase family protein [Bacteroidia bacterium]|nr:proline dehydrogenase family protein [Bacteroidia bacterium]
MTNKILHLDFSNTEIAFKAKTNSELRTSYFLFKAIGMNWLVKMGTPLIETAFALHLPIKPLIKHTVYQQFVGGENIIECEKAIDTLNKYHIGTILDYSVEGKETETDFENTCHETIDTIHKAKGNSKIPFCVFKVTGLARLALLEKINSNITLTENEILEFEKVKARIEKICRTAFENNVKIFIDAEETWIQNPIDEMATEMMVKFNKKEAIVYNTIQLYRHDRLAYLNDSFNHALNNNYYLGIKLVRGAYMEKERERAAKLNYADPIQINKENTDADYDKALRFCLENINRISICAGTHNEKSSTTLAQMMLDNNIEINDKRIYFSQLYGMSDNLSFNLANAGYNVAKYLPYGPVKDVMPYLFRRAAENTSVKGQTGRELNLILKEKARRAL